MKNRKLFVESIEKLDINMTSEQIDLFEKFMDEMIEWNDRVRLTSITDQIDIINKHFIDSLSILKADIFEDNMKIFDLGTGGGFPGIPLKIYNDSFELGMLDARLKKAEYLDHIIELFDFKDTYMYHGRAEDFGQDEEYREQYDVVVSRAVADLPTLFELCLPFVKVDGYFVAMKGPDIEDEFARSQNALEKLGGEFYKEINIELPNTDLKRSLLIIKKIDKTPEQYPRKSGKPKKKPIKG